MRKCTDRKGRRLRLIHMSYVPYKQVVLLVNEIIRSFKQNPISLLIASEFVVNAFSCPISRTAVWFCHYNLF